MFKWLRSLRSLPAIPEATWRAVLARYPFLAALATDERVRLRALSAQFLRDKQFHGAHGFVITDEVALAVAAQAVLPVLHLKGGLDWYDDFVGVIVHSSEVVAKRTTVDEVGIVHEYEEVVAGEAMVHGPIMLSWQDVLASSITSDSGYNVVIHEFAHKIDMRSGNADGCPPLPPGFAGARSAEGARAAWLATIHAAYDTFCEQLVIAERFGGDAPWLDPYGAESISEFFAVACEAYFVKRERFVEAFPTLRVLFDEFFKPNRA